MCLTPQWWAREQLLRYYLGSPSCSCLSELLWGCSEELLPHNLTDTLNKSVCNVKCNYVWQHSHKDPVKNSIQIKSHLLWLQNYLILFIYSLFLFSINILKSGYMEKYLNCHKYELILCMFTHAYYSCITGKVYYCATLTYTAMALHCGVPKFSEIHIWNYLFSAHSKTWQSGRHIFSLSTTLPYFWLMNFTLVFTLSTTQSLNLLSNQ